MRRNSYEIGEIRLDIERKNVVVEKELLVNNSEFGGFRISLIINKEMEDVFSVSNKIKLNIEKKIVEEGNTLKLYSEDGSAYIFDVRDGNTYTSNECKGVVIKKTSVGYKVIDGGFSVEEYNSLGYIEKVKDRVGNEIYTYTYESNKIKRFTSASGKSIEISYGEEVTISEGNNVVCVVRTDEVVIGNVGYEVIMSEENLIIRTKKSGVIKNRLEFFDNELSLYEGSILKKRIRFVESGVVKVVDEILGITNVYRLENHKIKYHYEEVEEMFLESGEDSRFVSDVNFYSDDACIGCLKEERQRSLLILDTLEKIKRVGYVGSYSDRINQYLISFWVKKKATERAYVSVVLAQNNISEFSVESLNEEWDLVTKVVKGVGTGSYETEIKVEIIKDDDVLIKDVRVTELDNSIKTKEKKVKYLGNEYNLENVLLKVGEDELYVLYEDLEYLQRQLLLGEEGYVLYNGLGSILECEDYQVVILTDTTNIECDIEDIVLVYRVEGENVEFKEKSIENNVLCERNYRKKDDTTTLLKEELYDVLNNKIRRKDYTGVETEVSIGDYELVDFVEVKGLQKRKKTYTYNLDFRVSKEKEESGEEVLSEVDYEYERYGKVINTTEEVSNNTLEVTYENGNIQKEVINEVHEVMYGYEEDRVEQISQGSTNYNLEYEGDKVKKIYEGNKLKVEYVYENNDLEVSVRIYTSENEYYTYKEYYDKYGRLIKRSKIVSGVEEILYEAKYNIGTLISTEYTVSNGSALLEEERVGLEVTKYRYIPGTKMLSRQEKGEEVKNYTYDRYGRIEEVDDGEGVEEYEYDNEVDNRIKKVTKDEYGSIEYVYDNVKRVIEEKKTILNTVYKKVYDYKLKGECSTNLISKVRYYRNNVITKTYEYFYDNNNNIVRIKKDNLIVRTYTYDSLNRLIKEDNKELNKSYTYEYDINGNIINKKESLYLSQEVIDEKVYEYEGINRLTKYDGNLTNINYEGNCCKIGKYMLTYNEGKLTKASYLDKINGSPTYSYTYNKLGQRVKKTYTFLPGRQNLTSYTTSSTNEYTYKDGKLVKEKINVKYNNEADTNIEIEYIYINHELVGLAIKENNVVSNYVYEKNVLGDIVRIYNTAGTVVAEYEYDAWGNHIININVNSVASLNPFRYRGYYYDVETGLFWLSSRYYSPELGRFIQPDSIEYLDPESINGLNLYSYCYNNPISYSDPSGHIPVDTIIDIGFAFWSFIDLLRNPSWENAGWFALDLACLIIPYATGGSTAVKGIVKGVNGADNLLDASKVPGYIMRNADDVVLLGQNMDRVYDASRKIGGGIIYGGLDDFASIKLKYGDEIAEALGYADNMKWIRKQAWSGKTVLNIGLEWRRLDDPIRYANSFKVCRGELFWYRAVMLGKFAAFWSHRIYRMIFGGF